MIEKTLISNRNIYANIFPFKLKTEDLFNLDLSIDNKELYEIDLASTAALSNYINNKLSETNTKYAIGGYAEDRLIYRRSKYFGEGDNARTIHLGVDVWCNDHTPLFAPLPSTIHSFNYNNNFGDYGATIILEHLLDDVKFYTLYGHLSKNSISNISVGDKIEIGEKFAEIGNELENGNWPPHLHFQIITDMLGNKGDFPGVASKQDKNIFLELCPNPDLMLIIK
jgi:murein DD-endopeptidase MepM/ murein hydrolase activator NlpD